MCGSLNFIDIKNADTQIAARIIPAHPACENLYEEESLYVKSARGVKSFIPKINGSVVSPALMAKQSERELSICLLQYGIVIVKNTPVSEFERSRALSVTDRGIFFTAG